MLKQKYFYTYNNILIPSIFVIEGVGVCRFKTKIELWQDVLYFFRKILAKIKNPYNNIRWVGVSNKSLSSFDYHIRDKGAIVDCYGNIHTTAKSYKNFLKENDLVIKDWSDDSNKPKQQLSDKTEIAKILNNIGNYGY